MEKLWTYCLLVSGRCCRGTQLSEIVYLVQSLARCLIEAFTDLAALLQLQHLVCVVCCSGCVLKWLAYKLGGVMLGCCMAWRAVQRSLLSNGLLLIVPKACLYSAMVPYHKPQQHPCAACGDKLYYQTTDCLVLFIETTQMCQWMLQSICTIDLSTGAKCYRWDARLHEFACMKYGAWLWSKCSVMWG